VHACTRKLPQQSIFDHSLHLHMLHFTHIRCFLKKERLVIPFLNVKSWIRKKNENLTTKDTAKIGPPQPLPPQPMIPLPLSIEHSSFWMIPRPLSIEHRAFWTMHQTFSVERSAFSMQRSALSIEHRALSIQRSALSAQHRASSIEHWALSIQHVLSSKSQFFHERFIIENIYRAHLLLKLKFVPMMR